jgi:hypothetical protein
LLGGVGPELGYDAHKPGDPVTEIVPVESFRSDSVRTLGVWDG